MGNTANLALPYPANTDPLANMAAAIQALAEAIDNGPAGAWVTWAPVWTGLTVGNGTVLARYKRIGKTVHFRLLLIFGSTTAVSGGVKFNLPVAAKNDQNQYPQCLVLASGGAAPYTGRLFVAAGLTDAFPYISNSGTATVLAQFGAFGMTLGANSRVEASGTYETT